MYQTDSPSLTHAELPRCVKWHLATHRPQPTRILPGSQAGWPRCVCTTSKGIIRLHVVPLKFDLAEGINDNGATKSVNDQPCKHLNQLTSATHTSSFLMLAA